jgi:hypothetical protein
MRVPKKKLEILEDKVVKAYLFFKSRRKTAAILGIPQTRVSEILHRRKAMRPWSGFATVKRWRGGNRGPVTRWIQAHPGVVLPKKTRELAKLVGCTPEDVHSWKTARAAKFKQLVATIVPKEAISSIVQRKLEVRLTSGKLLTFETLLELEKLR